MAYRKPYSRRHPPKRRRRRGSVPPPPDYRGKVVLVSVVGSRSPVLMSAKKAALQAARSKGGRRVQELGTGHRWRSSEEARAAITKCWRTRWRKSPRGIRIGRARNRRAAVARQSLREQYANAPDASTGIWSECSLLTRQWFWFQRLPQPNGYPVTRLSERTALRRLGHLLYPRKDNVPTAILHESVAPHMHPHRRKETKA